MIPGLNTEFLGETKDQGLWVENCLGCGDCMLLPFRRGVPSGPLLQAALQRTLRGLGGGEVRDQPGCAVRAGRSSLTGFREGRLGPAGADPPAKGLVEKAWQGAEKDREGGSAAMNEVSQLKKVLESGRFAVTAECGPPKGADPEAVLRKAEHPQGQGGRGQRHRQPDRPSCACRSLAACALLKSAGLDPVLQMVVQGPEPDRPSVGHPGCLGPGDPQRPLPVRGPPDASETSPRPWGSLTWIPSSSFRS